MLDPNKPRADGRPAARRGASSCRRRAARSSTPAAGRSWRTRVDAGDHGRSREACRRSPTTARRCWPGWRALLGTPQRDLAPGDHPVLAEGAGAVLDRRAVPAGAGGDRRARPRRRAGAVSEHREQFPGVAVETVRPCRDYPDGALAGAPARLHRRRSPRRTRSATAALHRRRHDRASRPRAAVRLRTARGRRLADRAARPAGLRRRDAARRSRPQPGDTLVTSIDRDVQKLAEQALAKQIARLAQGRQAGHRRRGRRHGPEHRADHRRRPATRPTTRSCSSAASRWPTTPS